jgi:hypothetical protein
MCVMAADTERAPRSSGNSVALKIVPPAATSSSTTKQSSRREQRGHHPATGQPRKRSEQGAH